MITLPSTSRRADEFAAALDTPTAATTKPELVELVEVVGALRTHAADAHESLTPRPEFTAQLRERLLAEAAESWVYDPTAARLELPARSGTRRERRLVVAATALVMAGGTAGMAAAAQQALPGEALYPIKRGLETARADLTSDDAAKGRTLLQQADGRLVEIRTLLDESAADAAVGSTLETYRDQAETGSDLLIRSYGETGTESDVSDVRGFALNGLSELESLASLVPADLRDDLDAVVTSLQDIDTRAADACPTCSPTDASAAPVSFRPALDDATRVLASLDASTLSNDHPLISPRIAPPTVLRPEADKPAAGAQPGTEGSGGAGDVTGGGEVPDSGGLADDVEDVTDGLKGGIDAGSPGGAGEVVEKVQKGVDDAERTVRDGAETVKETVEDVVDPLNDVRLP
jgi:hypothetical protein